MRWDAPGCLLNNTGVTAPGQSRDQGTGFWGTHFLTPQTDDATYYLFAAVRMNPISWGEPLDSEIHQKISNLRRIAFEDQDQMIIKAQQENMRRSPHSLKPVLFDIDVGPVRYKRILDMMIHEEMQADAVLTCGENGCASPTGPVRGFSRKTHGHADVLFVPVEIAPPWTSSCRQRILRAATQPRGTFHAIPADDLRQ